MNQTFSFTRFAWLHRWLWATKARTYLIGLGTLLLVGCLSQLPTMNSEYTVYNPNAYQSHLSFFIVAAVVLVVGLGSDVFSALFRQESALTYLMIPASRSEKFWLGAGYCVGALLAFTALYFSFDVFTYSVANGYLKAGQPRYTSTFRYYLSEGSTMQVTFFWLLLLLGIMLLGSLYFRRGVVARNVGIVLLLFTGFFLLYQGITGLYFRGSDMGINSPLPFTEATAYVSEKGGSNVGYSLDVPNWLTYAAYGLLLVGFWLTARIRFNELER